MTQVEYIELLFRECGYDTTKQRKAWLQSRTGVDYADELSTSQASMVIAELKEEKAWKSDNLRSAKDRDE